MHFLLLFVLFCLVRIELQLTCLGPVTVVLLFFREIILTYFTIRSPNHQTTLFRPTPFSPLKKKKKKNQMYHTDVNIFTIWQQLKCSRCSSWYWPLHRRPSFEEFFLFLKSPTQKHWQYTSHYSWSLFYETLCNKRSLFLNDFMWHFRKMLESNIRYINRYMVLMCKNDRPASLLISWPGYDLAY